MDPSPLTVALARLQPVCMEIVQAPSISNLEDFLAKIKVIDPKVMQELQQFLMFPLRCTLVNFLKKTMQQQILVNTCQALSVLLARTTVHTSSIFLDFLGLLSDTFFAVSPDGKRKQKLSEEETMSVLDAVDKLMTSATDSVKKALYAVNSLPLLGSLVSQMVSLVSETKNGRNLQLKAMHGLRTLMQINCQCAGQMAWQLGSRFAGLLPGISTAMLKVVMGDTKQGHHVFCTALSTWTDVVCLTLGDMSLSEEHQTNNVWLDKAELDEKLKNLVVERSEVWVTSVVPRVDFMLKEFSKLKKHDSWRVRQTLVEVAHRILTECQGSLRSCVPAILEILVSLMADEYAQVSEPAINALRNFQERQEGSDGCRSLKEMLEEGLLVLITSFVRRMKMEDEDEKVALINLLNGYISMLGNQTTLFLSPPHMSRLAQALVQVMELDCSDQKILEETGIGAGGGTTDHSKFVDRVTIMKPRKKFVHFQSDKVQAGLMRTCHLLGLHGELSVLVGSFLEVYRQSTAHRLASVLIINEIMAGSAIVSGEQAMNTPAVSIKTNIIRMLIEEYLSPTNMTLCETVDSSQNTNSNSSYSVSLYMMEEAGEKPSFILTKNKAIFLSCLYLEGIGIFAKALGKDFRFLLMDILYILAEKVGSEVSSVSSTAYLALVDISCACGYSNLDDFIQENSDYLVNSVSLRLRHFDQNHRAPSVLSVMLQFCSVNILPLVWDSIIEILETLDENYEDQAVLFLRVLHHVMLAIGRWYPPQAQPKLVRKQHHVTQHLDPARLVAVLLERHQQRLAAENFDDEPLDDENVLQEEEKTREEEHDQPEVPPHIKAVKKVLLRAKNLLALNNPRMVLLAVDVVTQGCIDLADHENELLPMIHKVWEPLKQRFCDHNKLIVIKAVKALHTMCSLCGDFIRKRVEKDILPTLLHFLLKQSATSEGSGSAYQYTLDYKLQKTLLTTLGDIAYMMELDGVALEQVIDSCQPYLNERQPQKLQELFSNIGVSNVFSKNVGLLLDCLDKTSEEVFISQSKTSIVL
ncbi:TELO2-interacting protein 1 homolog isoform X2 [Pomacea canaliculata]|uniref:TELO2-interacting protein 1 homolog isoform X2 n=1 Tax=Pomacea canaliculata TaxID=400727 RepID=UPI000D72EBF4|nr:TELO2-interacting protein 1 homolog isoform X2 [Pomacea canaliculata]